MAATQLPLDLAWRRSTDAGDFIVGAANEAAVVWIDNWPNWPSHGLLLLGPEASGKTHLAQVWRAHSGAQLVTGASGISEISSHAVLDDIDDWAVNDPAALFHLLNRAKEDGFSLLLCTSHTPDAWGVTLPDLLSRLKALPVARLEEPDDALLAALFTQALGQRGIILKPDVLDYLFPRLPRQAAEIAPFAEALDDYALAHGKGPTLSVVRQFMQREG